MESNDQRLAEPRHLFASRVDLAAGSKSKRSKQTLTPIAQALGVSIDDSCAKGKEVGLANAIMPKTGIVLVAWERQKIPAIVQAIVGDTTSAPQAWPHDRFDVVWILDWQDSGWKFDEAPQLLLAGDSPNGIS